MEIFAAFARYIFRTFICKATFIILYCSQLVALQWCRNRWPWMTLHGHFALKSISGSATIGLASPAVGPNCWKICRATHVRYCQRQKCSPGNVVSGSIGKVYAHIRGGSLERERQMKMAIFASFVHCLPNILHTWPHDSFQVINDLGHISRSLDCFTSNFS